AVDRRRRGEPALDRHGRDRGDARSHVHRGAVHSAVLRVEHRARRARAGAARRGGGRRTGAASSRAALEKRRYLRAKTSVPPADGSVEAAVLSVSVFPSAETWATVVASA